MSVSSNMNYIEWDKKVRESIAEDWLKLIEENNSLGKTFSEILKSLYTKYKPQQDGSWSASPRWGDMFNWTSCPLEGVRAVILLKRPILGSDFESTGYGAGVQLKSGLKNGQRISEIGTVWSMLEVARQCLQHPDDDLEDLVESKYQNGFNPKYLSQRGILFLNVALTTGHSDHRDYENSDMYLWQTFTLGLLNAIQGTNIPLFQWYITKVIRSKLSNWKSNGKFMVSKPKILDLGDGPHKHICYFEDDQLMDYADELMAKKKYLKHRTILEEIYKSIVCESKVQTYPVKKESHSSIKRNADIAGLGYQNIKRTK